MYQSEALPAEAAVAQRHDFTRRPHGLLRAIGQERQHRGVADIDMRQCAPTLGRARDHDARPWRAIAAVEDGIALDRCRPRIIFYQIGYRSALGLGFGLIVEILREAGGGDRLLAQHDAMIVGGEAPLAKRKP